MTKKEMIIKLIDDQIKRGVINANVRGKQIALRIKTMTKTEVEIWFADVFGNK